MKKNILKRALVAGLSLCMLAAAVPKGSLTAKAAELTNLAPSATITTMVRDTDSDYFKSNIASTLSLLNDGKKDTSAKPIWRGGLTATAKGTVGPVGDYYEFTWNDPVSINRVDLYFWQTTYSGPSAWHVDVTEDGTNWKTVGTVIDAEMEAIWQASVPSRELTFKLQENVRALRVYIDKGYLEGAGYGIHEIEIFSDPDVVIEDPEPEDPEPVNGNYASIATITTPIKDTDSNYFKGHTAEIMRYLNDGKKDKAAPELWRGGFTATAKGAVGDVGEYYEFTWTKPISVNKVDLYLWHTAYQAPSAWHIDVTKDGTTWNTVATLPDANLNNYWEPSEDGVPVASKSLVFALQEDVKALRVCIDKAYLQDTAGYGIKEIEIFNDPNAAADPEPEDPKPAGPQELKPANGNYASIAKITTAVRDTDSATYKDPTKLAECLSLLNDGKKDTSAKSMWRGGLTATAKGTVGPVGDYYEFTWDGVVSINRVDLYFWHTGYQAPSAWHVDVTTDGTTWKTVGTITDAKMGNVWEASVPSKSLTFALQTNVKALRVYIDKAYMEDANGNGGYGIHEIEILNVPGASPSTGDDMPTIPVMFVFILSVAGAIVLGCRKYRKYN